MTEPSRKDFVRARDDFHRQLDQLGLRHVVVIDEEALSVPPSHLVQLADELSDAAFEEQGLAREDRGTWTTETFADLSPERQRQIHVAWREMLKEPTAARDAGRGLDVLAFLAGERYEPLLPDEWDARASDHATFAAHDLVLFDHDLRGFDRQGRDLLEAFRDQFPDAKAALLTTTIDYGDDRPPDFTRFGPRILAASKQQLTEAPLEFVDDVRLARAVPELDRARSVLLEVAREAHDRAVAFVRGEGSGDDTLDFRTLEEVMVHVASEDGIWEADALLRVLAIVYRAQIREKLLPPSGEPASELPPLLDKVRAVYADRTARSAAGLDKARKLVQMESYERGELINEAGLPLACGDMFYAKAQPPVGGERGESDAPEAESRHWVLVDQACDLQLRSAGTRGRLDGTELVRLYTATVKRDGRKLRVPLGDRDYALAGFSRVVAPDEPSKVPVAQFSTRLFVPYDVLELCVFDRGGRCRIDVDRAEPDPVPQTPGLLARYTALRDHYRALVDDIAGLDHDVQAQVLLRGRLAGTLDGRILEWPVQRVERLREARAQGALQALANDRSRPAFDRDLAEPAP